MFQGCRAALDRLEEEPFSAAWRKLVMELAKRGQEGQACLHPLGDTRGGCSGREQRQAVSLLRRRLEELTARAEEDRRRMGRVYQTLGLSGGAFLVILLL